MNPSDILDRLEDGSIDVGRALELFRAGAGASAQPPPLPRSSTGRIVLRPTGEKTSPGPHAARGPVGLRPLASRATNAPPPSQEVVRLERPEPGIAVVALEDEAGRNMFTPGLIEGLERTLLLVRADLSVRVVVVRGLANWFCTGGTPELLADIRAGRATFDDTPGYRALLDLEVPVIAAMEGHALGGGLTFGLYADLIVLAEESHYAGNFMDHGFTPGVGATLLFPLKFGEVLGPEMLFTARRYAGRELVERGAPVLALPRARVLARALELARELAAKPRAQLVLLKRRLTARTREALPAAIEAELAMHREIFREGNQP